MAARMEIDPGRLALLAGDPTLKSGKIAALFGYGRATFFSCLSQHEDLWEVYAKARHDAGFQVSHTKPRRHALEGDDQKIINAIGQGCRTLTAIAQSAEFDLSSFAARMYNLEHERHEIWSMQVGHGTHYFLRSEEATQAKGAAAC